ncbi:hypothetical protein CSUI_003472 [Cystoisospora suis]|uniref:Uncharacterized protein n=1 Tax=Cystoisospora suis TaxID=483139 RepID=A0A2C6KF99_9APIC|nr:hypothetical protein CSUI_003472 [Cystoisospora suis]
MYLHLDAERTVSDERRTPGNVNGGIRSGVGL